MANPVNLRALALEILIEVNEKEQYSHLVLRSVLEKYQYLQKQERAFLTRLVEGTLERQIELDYIINSFSKVSISKMKPLIRNLLRMSVYQLKYMDSIPDSAVCNEAVKLAKKRGFARLSGFVNGVLRASVREMDSIVYPDREKEPQHYLSIRYSMPQWIIEKWMDTYGMDRTEEMLRNLLTEEPITIRTNLQKCTPKELSERLAKEGVAAVPVQKLDYAFSISGFDHLNALDSFREGWFYVQDISSMMVVELAGAKPGSYVIDVCAAPGGKSTHMAEKLSGTGMVEARDLTEHKVELIEENIARHRLSNMKAVCMDATVSDEASIEKADILICDLPCSGLGVMGKKTDIRYKMTPEKQEALIQLQRQILDTVYRYVKPGGVLMYSTCTIHRGENEDNVSWFLQKYPQFTLEYQEQMLPGEAYKDGFFLAKLVYRGA